MNLPSFTEQDFSVFNIDGLEQRMEAIKRIIRPKFEIIGEQVSPHLTMLIGEPVSVHIAKHARRTVNPPEETWVAWSTSKRGYKALPHFQFGIRDTHLFIWFALIYECDRKAQFARNLKEQLPEFWSQIPDHFYLSQDHTSPSVTRKHELDLEGAEKMLDRLEKVKKAEFLCGTLIPRQDAVHTSGEAVVKMVEQTFSTLSPLYRLALA
jgi:uncharacterized protein YktB (UPF0637 family)